MRELALDRGQDLGRVVDAQRGLRHHRQLVAARAHLGHVLGVLDQVDALAQLAHRAFDLGVALVADHDEFIALLGQLGHLHMHLGDQRAGGVEDLEAALGGLGAHRLADAVRAEHQRGAGRHVGQVLDEDRALGLQVVDHVGVVHDLVAHVDRRAELAQRALDDLDGPVHAGTEAARFGQHHFVDVHVGHHSTPISCTSKLTAWPASGWLKSNSSQSSPSSRTTPAKAPCAVRRGELHHVAGRVVLVRRAQLLQQAARHALQHVRVALAEGLARGQREGLVGAFGQADQPRFHRRRQLAGAQRQRGRLVVEGVHHVGAVGPAQAVMQGQEGAGLDAVHGA